MKRKAYPSDLTDITLKEEKIRQRINSLLNRTGMSIPNEPLLEKLTDQLPNYGINTFQDIFVPRQKSTPTYSGHSDTGS